MLILFFDRGIFNLLVVKDHILCIKTFFFFWIFPKVIQTNAQLIKIYESGYKQKKHNNIKSDNIDWIGQIMWNISTYYTPKKN